MLTETQKSEMRANIARGVEYLDGNIPDWRSQIDWDRFEFVDFEKCIWGQLNPTGLLHGLDSYSVEYGFNVPKEIHRDAGCDDERQFTDDENPADICPYHFMDHEWSKQAKA